MTVEMTVELTRAEFREWLAQQPPDREMLTNSALSCPFACYLKEELRASYPAVFDSGWSWEWSYGVGRIYPLPAWLADFTRALDGELAGTMNRGITTAAEALAVLDALPKEADGG